MKIIIATSLNYTPLRRLESVTLYYENGTLKNIKMNPLKKQSDNLNYSLVKYFSEEFHPKRHNL